MPVKINKDLSFNALINNSMTLAPIPDEENLYCLCNPTCKTNLVDKIPNIDTLLSSYKWENLFHLEFLIQELDRDSKKFTLPV